MRCVWIQCNSCDSNYVGYTSCHLHLRIEEHKYSVIGKHLKDKHNQRSNNLHEQFTTLKKCRGKFECLIYEMLLRREKRPTLNTQNDPIPAKLFIQILFILLFFPASSHKLFEDRRAQSSLYCGQQPLYRKSRNVSRFAIPSLYLKEKESCS